MAPLAYIVRHPTGLPPNPGHLLSGVLEAAARVGVWGILDRLLRLNEGGKKAAPGTGESTELLETEHDVLRTQMREEGLRECDVGVLREVVELKVIRHHELWTALL